MSLRELIKSAWENPTDEQHKLRNDYVSGNSRDGKFIRLRLDWSINKDSLEEVPEKEIISFMQEQVFNDINDLVIFGDTESTDVLYKSLDGVVKTKTLPRYVIPINIDVKKEFTKSTVDYIIFFILYLEFE